MVHGGSNGAWCEFVYRHGRYLLTKRGSEQHRHCPKQMKISNISSVQHADLGVPNSPFQGLSECTPHPPPPPSGHTRGKNKATMTTTTENPPSWRKTFHLRGILRMYWFFFWRRIGTLVMRIWIIPPCMSQVQVHMPFLDLIAVIPREGCTMCPMVLRSACPPPLLCFS